MPEYIEIKDNDDTSYVTFKYFIDNGFVYKRRVQH